jgi:general secretion pathway protein E
LALKELIHNQASEADIRQSAMKGGMQMMREDGLRLVQEQLTTMEELIRVTRD